jgi:hypothetical protein
MTIREKVFHSLIISMCFSFINWKLIDFFLVKMSFWRYVAIELILIVSIKFFKFTKQKLNLND